MIEIDGAFGEGGGQILRTSLTLSALTGQPMRIHHIRSKRRQPGLRPQHLTAVNAAAKITRAETLGAALDSMELTFAPSGIFPGKYKFDIYTAGALSLVLQTLFLPLSFASRRSQLMLTGGTHVNWSPIFNYLEEQWLPVMRNLGFRLEIDLAKAGFFPAGGGEVQASILPIEVLHPLTCIDRGALVQMRGLSGVANLPDEIAKRQKHQALKRLYAVCEEAKIKTIHLPAYGKGTFILLKAMFSNCGSACYTALGAPGKPAEQVADEAVDSLLAFLDTDGCVDHFLADQLLLPLALIPGNSIYRTNAITQHLLTNVYVIQSFLDIEIKVDGQMGKPGLIQVSGVDHRDFSGLK